MDTAASERDIPNPHLKRRRKVPPAVVIPPDLPDQVETKEFCGEKTGYYFGTIGKVTGYQRFGAPRLEHVEPEQEDDPDERPVDMSWMRSKRFGPPSSTHPKLPSLRRKKRRKRFSRGNNPGMQLDTTMKAEEDGWKQCGWYAVDSANGSDWGPSVRFLRYGC